MYREKLPSDTELDGDDVSLHQPTDDSPQFQQELTELSSVLGRKWNLVIVNQLLRNGPMGFSELLDSVDGISSKVLSESLSDLEAVEFVHRDVVSERPFRVEYSLTHRGVALESLIDKVRAGHLRVS
ncbi:helix-turn-helix domain-containing protein [Haloarculaceae archaeon H-GB2-1]|nr:helix-turn-helix domain-containing protein [Haloarculaceae archaeon H-GB1-1]MEA5389518.1 helix-turn-helix domain-containing protein [Haloarculaceae archaeon H-GB11]MEA5410028.1 helix-turn-helix domain-containing protein [Haloarculaceae archaeon H-GB2-1]